MGLSIKSKETERAVRQLASVTGESLTDAVHSAVVLRLKTVGRKPNVDVDQLADLRAWFAELDAARIPNAPSREEIEADMYDENGLPR